MNAKIMNPRPWLTVISLVLLLGAPSVEAGQLSAAGQQGGKRASPLHRAQGFLNRLAVDAQEKQWLNRDLRLAKKIIHRPGLLVLQGVQGKHDGDPEDIYIITSANQPVIVRQSKRPYGEVQLLLKAFQRCTPGPSGEREFDVAQASWSSTRHPDRYNMSRLHIVEQGPTWCDEDKRMIRLPQSAETPREIMSRIIRQVRPDLDGGRVSALRELARLLPAAGLLD